MLLQREMEHSTVQRSRNMKSWVEQSGLILSCSFGEKKINEYSFWL